MGNWIEGNMGRVSPCPLCEEEEDTTEHVFKCGEIGEVIKIATVKDLQKGEKMLQVVDIFDVNEEKRREE